MGRIYVLHENDAWVEPLREAFTDRGLAYHEWFLDDGVLDLGADPPEGVFYNRMSASSHTRGHRYGPEYAGAVLAWLTRHGRRVVNDGRALQLSRQGLATSGGDLGLLATGPLRQAMGPHRSGAGLGVGMLRGAGDSLT